MIIKCVSNMIIINYLWIKKNKRHDKEHGRGKTKKDL